MAATATPLPRPDVEALIIQEIFTNANGKIDGDRLQRVLLYMATSAPNILTDGLPPGGGGPNPDYAALLRAIAQKADRSELVSGLAGKEPRFAGLAASEVDADKAAYAGLLLKQLLIKIVNALGAMQGAGSPALSIAAMPNGNFQPNRSLLAYLNNGGEIYWMSPDPSGQRTSVQASSFGVAPANTANANAMGINNLRTNLLGQ